MHEHNGPQCNRAISLTLSDRTVPLIHPYTMFIITSNIWYRSQYETGVDSAKPES